MSLTPRGMSIQEAYRLFADSHLIINRRYQRKLVWGEDEKRHLIDSIQRNFPIPLFMFARVDQDEAALEVIDGMQRLHAIFSFIEHRFKDEQERCFDIMQNSRARIQRDAGVFAEFGPEVARLTDKECAAFLEYQLAVTIDTEGDDTRINEVFGRINSSGRRLSPQEQRQAGLVSGFSEFVRRLAMELRGDDSPDILPLNEMPSVSFNTPKEKQGYGVDATDVFWCKHGVILPADLAKAEDEQVLADISISLLNKTPLNASREAFDSYFSAQSDDSIQIAQKLTAYGAERLRNEIIAVISNVRATFENPKFMAIRTCVQEKPANTARTAFFAIFMAYYDLIVTQGRRPDNFVEIRSALSGLQGSLTMQAHYTKTEDRVKNIAITTGLVQKHFIKQDVPVFGGAHSLVIDLENSLRRSRYEASRYEFKIGCCRLSAPLALEEDIYKKLARTAAAIANTSPLADGYIYLGVADKKADADRVIQLCGAASYEIGDVYFVGIQHDLQCLGLTLEAYVKKLIQEIQKTALSEPLKTQLVTCLEHAEYRGAPFIRLRVPAQSRLTEFGGEYPIRKNSDTLNMTTAEALAQAQLFA
jgi:hypothetical protein